MNVLVIGSGGREHALCWKLAQSPRLGKLYCAPGNAGIAQVAEIVPLDIADQPAVVAFCEAHRIGLVVVGPEQPLVDGLVDTLRKHSIHAFGPTAAAAQLEGSKGFTKDLCQSHGIPTAAYERFDDLDAARAYLAEQPLPIVIKADGLAAGKGVVIAETREAADAAIEMMSDGGLGEAGTSVVIEEFLTGEEASLFALVDGATAIAFGSAQDHKRVGDGDTGPNTGGMGAYSPAPVLTPELQDRAMREIVEPTARAMASGGMPFHGVLYAGLMLTADGPKLIEYNARFGDPECQVLMARLDSDLLDILQAVAEGQLWEVKPRWKPETALVVVMAGQGYPGTPKKGTEIRGIDAAEATGATVFHAGTRQDDERLLADGGRVLGVTALGESVTEAQRRAYRAVDEINWPGGFCRRDIGWRAIERECAS